MPPRTCDHGAVMPENTEVLQRKLQTYKGLVEVSTAINSITEYCELLRAILDIARRVFSAERASLFLVDEESGDLELVIATQGETDYVEPKLSVPHGRGIAGWVFDRGEPVAIADAYRDKRFFKEADRLTGFVTKSILCAPLKRDSKIIGVLQILNSRDKEIFDDVDLEVFCAYVNLTATAIEKLRAIERIRHQERIDRDIAIAAEIQRELLSRAIPPDLSGAKFFAYNSPAANIGGDFYAVFPSRAGEIYFAIGDVSGKGISASLLMAQTLNTMRFVFAAATSPSHALGLLNETLFANIIRGMFITTLVGKMDTRSRQVEIASAGHCPPLLVKASGDTAILGVTSSVPIGIRPGTTYENTALTLHSDNRLVFYTDGLSESRRNGAGAQFDESLADAASGPASSPEEILSRIIEAERLHRGEGSQLDDLTVLVGGFE